MIYKYVWNPSFSVYPGNIDFASISETEIVFGSTSTPPKY